MNGAIPRPKGKMYMEFPKGEKDRCTYYGRMDGLDGLRLHPCEKHPDIKWSVKRRKWTIYTRGSMTTLHDFGGVLGRPLDTFFWALTISWSPLLVRV